MRSFDFSSYYQNENLSDCVLFVRVDGNVQQRIPGHGVVLCNVSRVFKAQIEQQQGQGQQGGGRPSIHLDVSPDQVPAACALVRYVYTGDLPDVAASHKQQLMLVHMLHLAHTFAVSDCQAACYQVLTQCSNLQPAALGLTFQLLLPVTAFAPLLGHCLDQLQQQLGDLEAVLRCPEQLAQLHSLPLPALLALLRDDRTAAASENTVLAAVHSWMAAAAQRDVRVDAAQREQLAGAVRVPLLEPCYMATVVPRMAWLLETLGPQGLAAAAGVARGLCDPHAEAVLGNARACGPLAAGWLQGPRPMPASCSRAMHGGPALTLEWDLPLSDLRAAFEAACADAAAKAALSAQQQREASAAAAAARQSADRVSTEAPGWGLGFRSPFAPASAAAAASAVASVAAAAAARVFNKRKRSLSTAIESCDEGGRDQHSSSTGTRAAGRAGLQHRCVAAGEDEEEEGGPASQGAGLHKPAASDATEDAAGDLPLQHTRKRRRRVAGPSSQGAAGVEGAGGGAAAAAAAATNTTPSKAAGSRQRHHAGPRLLQPLSPQAGIASPQADGTAGFFSQEPAAAAAAGGGAAGLASPAAGPGPQASLSESGAQLQGLRHLKLRSPETQFAGYSWRLVLYFQPCASSGAAASQQRARNSGARGAVAAAHAVGLPDDAAAEPEALSSCTWTARLAVEARPAVSLQHGVSTAAFSGSLAIRLAPGPRHSTPAAAARGCKGGSQAARGHRSKAAAITASPAAAAAGAQGVAAPSPSRRLISRAEAGDSPARYTCAEAEAAAAARPGSRQRGGREQSPAGRQLAGAAAVAAAGHTGLQGLLSIPESDADEDENGDEESDEGSSSSESQPDSDSASESSSDDQEQSQRDAAQDSDDEGFQMVGEFPAGSAGCRGGGGSGRAAAAAATGGTPRRSAGRQSQQQQQRGGGRPGGRRPSSAGGADREQQLVTPGVTPAARAGRGTEEGAWTVFHLPQGSWVKSRLCDTGFSNFAAISMQQGVWDEAAWQAYLQPGQTLQLRGEVWNVR